MNDGLEPHFPPFFLRVTKSQMHDCLTCFDAAGACTCFL